MTSTSTTPHRTAKGNGQLPRNLVKLASQATADGWTVTTQTQPRELTLTLTARVQAGAASAAATFRCVWQANGSGGFRWAGASLYRDGAEVRSGIGWRDVAPLVASGTATMVDPVAEASGATYEGRTAEEWRQVADRHAEAAAGAYGRGCVVLDMLARKRGSTFGPLNGATLTEEQRAFRAQYVPVWVDVAEEGTRAAYRRLDRRSKAAHEAVCRAGYEIAEAQDIGETPDARRAYELADRARILAEACGKDVGAVEAGALDAEATAVCEPYVAAITAEMEQEESQWRAANPTGDVRQFARSVIETIGRADERFAEWWEERARPGMAYFQGWDAYRAGQSTGAEVRASLRLWEETNRALFAMGAQAASHLRWTDDADQVARADRLAAAAERGAALYAPGASRRSGEGDRVAASVWSLMRGRGWVAGMSANMAANIAAVEEWTGTCAVTEAEEVRRLCLVRHGLDLRDRAHAAVREEIKAAEAERAKVARAAYDAARAAGESDEAAREAASDARARVEADVAGRVQDGRDQFKRGDAVWVAPAEGSGNGRYVADVVCYTRSGCFRVRDVAHGATVDVHGDRLEIAAQEEAEADRTRQRRVRARREAERERRNAEARARAAAAEAQRRAREEWTAARVEAARTATVPVASGGVWAPECEVPASVDELWGMAALNGWAMTRETRGDGWSSMIVVRIQGTTDRGRWAFRLVWTVSRGRYSANKQASRAVWADGRSGPRGGEIRPTISDVLRVMSTETHEGVAAPFGALVAHSARQADRRQDGNGSHGSQLPAA